MNKIIFASVDRSPHCTQLHYIQDEILKLGFNVEFENYVAVENKLVKIDREVISLSKNLSNSYLFNIKIGKHYLLIKCERRNQYQPVGGCYKYFPEAEEFLSLIGAIPEKQFKGISSDMDLRLMLPKQNVLNFAKNLIVFNSFFNK